MQPVYVPFSATLIWLATFFRRSHTPYWWLVVLYSLSVTPGFAQQPKLYGLTSQGGSDNIGAIVSFTPGSTPVVPDVFSLPLAAGAFPLFTSLTELENRLYGMTGYGGSNGVGVLFVYDPATTTYTKLYDFSYSDGATPAGSLTVYNGKLYGMTAGGGNNGGGVLFVYDPATTAYTKLYDFSDRDGANPAGSLTVYNGKLYGLTAGGGSNGQGVLFAYDPVTMTYTKLKDFSGSDGANPEGSLTVYSNKLYGMTPFGGSNGVGVLFAFDPATTTYTKLKDFSNNDGASPSGSLTVYNDKLYGMTTYGGGGGVMFAYDPATTTYTKLKDFSDSDGAFPFGLLTVYNGKLYGMTVRGGNNERGVMFAYDPATTTYTKLKDFSDSDGTFPQGSLTVYNGKLYGMTTRGGRYETGVMFVYDPATATYITLKDFSTTSFSDGANPYGSLTVYNGKLYGMTSQGGSNRGGALFVYDPTTFTYTKLRDFLDGDGAYPYGSLTVYNSKLYGMTFVGGSNGVGAVFVYDPVTTTYTKLNDFSGSDGANPYGSLTVYNNKLYGMTYGGGSNGKGVLFVYDPATTTYTKLKDFSYSDGANPYGSLTVYNGKLYGMTRHGGSNSGGVLFVYDPVSTSYTKLKGFSGSDGANPLGSLTVYNGKLYGMTVYGGSNGLGVLFAFDPATTTYTKLNDFSGSDGANPKGSLMVYNGKLYGMTYGGGSNDKGVTFSLDPVTNTYTKLFDFTGSNGAAPAYGQFVAFPCALSATALVSSGTVCVGGVVSLSATVTANEGTPTFAWQRFAGGSLGQPTTASTISATLNQPGTQTFTVVVTDGGCSATATTLVTAVALPSSPTLTNSVSQLTACQGTAVSLSVSCDVGQAEFSTDASFSSLTVGSSLTTPTAAGSYSYVVRCSNLGCTSSTTTVTATVYAAPGVPSFTASGLLTCAVRSVTLTATSGLAAYAFSQGATPLSGFPNQATVSAGGTYSVVVTNGYGCSATATTLVTGSTAGVGPVFAQVCGVLGPLLPAVTISASSAGATSYSLSGPNTATSNSTGIFFVGQAGSYQITASNGAGERCSASATVLVEAGLSAPVIICSTTVLLTSTPLTLTALAQGIRFVFEGPGGYVFSNVYRQRGQYLAYASGITMPGRYTLTIYDEDGSSFVVGINVVAASKGGLWADPGQGGK